MFPLGREHDYLSVAEALLAVQRCGFYNTLTALFDIILSKTKPNIDLDLLA